MKFILVKTMSRVCSLSGVAVQAGNNVSHSQRKTRRRFLPNLQKVTLISDALKQSYRMRVAASVLRTVEFKGGLDGYLLTTKDYKLSNSAKVIKRKIAKSLAANENA